MFVGTHRRAHRSDATDIAFGIYGFAVEEQGLRRAGMVETPQPGWITSHPELPVLYAVNEVRQDASVSSFAIEPDGHTLTALTSRPTPPMPCHCSVDATGRYLLVATFAGGSVHLFGLESDGSIGAQLDAHQHVGSSVHPRRQTGPHPHAVVIDPTNRFVLVPDLGTDRLNVYELDLENARLLPRLNRAAYLTPGSGPRHVAFNGNGTLVYLMNEMSASISVYAFDNTNGALSLLQSVDLLPTDFLGVRSGAAIAISPDGHFLYSTTRSHGSSGEPPIRGLDSIVWFEIASDGTLEFRGRTSSQGQIPRSFTLDAAGERLYVAHQCSGSIVTFGIEEDGTPAFSGEVISTPVPVCVHLVA